MIKKLDSYLNRKLDWKKFRILHYNKFYNFWKVLVTLGASYLAFSIPLDLLFNLHVMPFYSVLNNLFSIIFILDILVSIYEGQRDDDLNPYGDDISVVSYLKTYLLPDIIAAIPIVLLGTGPFQLIKLIKLVKVAHFISLVKQKEIRMANTLSLIFLFFWIFHAIHWLSCGWVSMKGIDSNLDSYSNYVKAVYWAVTTLTTVGYGDITAIADPQNNSLMLYAVFVELVGVMGFGLLIGNIAGILSKRDPAKSKYIENIDNLAGLINYRPIPDDLQLKLRNYYTYIYKKREGYDEESFLNGLPSNLAEEVALHLKKDVVSQIPIFKGVDAKFIREIAIRLQTILFTPGDYVFKAGDDAKEMYFIVKGDMEIYSKDEEKLLATLSDGDFFGEVALFKDQPRNATIKAATYCDLYSLSKKEFDMVMAKYPVIAKGIEDKAKMRGA